MKSLTMLTIVLGGSLFFDLVGQPINVGTIQQQIPLIFKFNHIDSVASNTLLADLVNNNRMYLDYVVKNNSYVDYSEVKRQSVGRNIDSIFAKHLIADSVFNFYFLESAYFFLSSQKKTINGYPPREKLIVSKNQLLSIASKFFYAENIRGARISWKVCAGINGYRQSAMNLDRMHLVEAFCFMTVFKFLFSPEYTYEKRFSEKMGEINQSISKAAAEKKND